MIFPEAIASAQDLAADYDTIMIHRQVVGCDDYHVNDDKCWCDPVAISAN